MRPWRFAVLVVALHTLAIAPLFLRHHADPSAFIVAGDRYVARDETPSPIVVRAHSDGYDGQFYYRLAMAPFLAEPRAFGVTLDHPAWRMQRILLPVVAWIASAGQPATLPVVLLAINLAGLFAIGWLAALIAGMWNMPALVPICIAAWPGLFVALTHDTTEILAAALLLAGIAAWLARRWAVCAVCLALASLTRETAILVTGGLFLVQAWAVLRPGTGARPWRAAACAAAALLPFLAWRQAVAALWHDAPQAHGLAENVGWPGFGFVETLLAAVFKHAIGAARSPPNSLVRSTTLWGLGAILLICVRTGRLVPAALRTDAAGLMVGWLLVLALMSTLTANGPFVEPTAFLRAFTECWITGWVLIGLSGGAVPRARWVAMVLVPLIVLNWKLCWSQV
jgi:hypothetical protein